MNEWSFSDRTNRMTDKKKHDDDDDKRMGEKKYRRNKSNKLDKNDEKKGISWEKKQNRIE